MTPIRYLERCPFCFAQNSCALRFTKVGKPYLVCPICMSRAFLNRLEGLRGVAVVPELISLAVTSAEQGNAPWVDERIRETTSYVRNVMSGRGLPEAPEPVPYNETRAPKENVA